MLGWGRVGGLGGGGWLVKWKSLRGAKIRLEYQVLRSYK